MIRTDMATVEKWNNFVLWLKFLVVEGMRFVLGGYLYYGWVEEYEALRAGDGEKD